MRTPYNPPVTVKELSDPVTGLPYAVHVTAGCVSGFQVPEELLDFYTCRIIGIYPFKTVPEERRAECKDISVIAPAR